jgi:hypothetical protein
MVVERGLVRAGLGGELRRAGADGGRGNGGSVCKQSTWACTWEINLSSALAGIS